MVVRLGVALFWLLLAVPSALAVRYARTHEERLAPLGRLVFTVGFAAAILVAAWAPALALALLLIAGAALAVGALPAWRKLRR